MAGLFTQDSTDTHHHCQTGNRTDSECQYAEPQKVFYNFHTLSYTHQKSSAWVPIANNEACLNNGVAISELCQGVCVLL